MPQVSPKNHTVSDIYRAWCLSKVAEDSSYYLEFDGCIRAKGIRILCQKTTTGRTVVMTYTLFRKVLEVYNQHAAEAVIHGSRFNLGGRLGYIHGRRIEYNFRRPKVNIIATVQARKTEPDHPAIYHTEDDYCRIAWQKYHRIKNESVYSFSPASHTVRDKFSQTLKANPVLKSLYKYYPYVREKQIA